MRDVKIVQTALLTWGVQVAEKAEEGNNEKGKEEQMRKQGILDRVVEEA